MIKKSISAVLHIIAMLVVVGSVTVVSADEECRREITENDDSWNDFLNSIENSNEQGCNDHPMKALAKHSKEWRYARKVNLNYISKAKGKKLDVVMVGDSIIEKWHGTKMGQSQSEYKDNAEVFKKYFDIKDGKVAGLALGVGSDRITNLLYRLQNGEMDEDLQPDVWWILIGTNDVSAGCKDEYIVAGIINIAELILGERPQATVVINSLLPREKNGKRFKESHFKAINEALECYADDTDRVEFFDATDIFLKNGEVNLKLLTDGLHPGKRGCEEWGAEIVKTVKTLT